MLLFRKPLFRYICIAYSVLMITNYLINSFAQTGTISALNVIIALVLGIPWNIYLFRSKRVKSVLFLSPVAEERKTSDLPDEAFPADDGESHKADGDL